MVSELVVNTFSLSDLSYLDRLGLGADRVVSHCEPLACSACPQGDVQ